MCRLYGQISVAPSSAFDFLADSPRSLLVQGDFRPSSKQKDGWGIGSCAGKSAVIVKSVKPVFAQARRWKAVASKIRSGVVIGHLRAASNPKGLPARSILGMNNTQPFTDGHILFAHNGTLQIPDEVAAFLGPFRGKLRGVNDSEVFFWQFMKHLRLLGDAPAALEACVQEDWTLWRYCQGRYPKKKGPYTGLNALVSDGNSLHALCLYDSNGSSSLFDPKKPWGQMSLGVRDGRVIVASEDMDDGRWSRLQQGEIVSAVRQGNKIQVRRRRIRLDKRGLP